jgi:transglutaminase-like putative cysteine protease
MTKVFYVLRMLVYVVVLFSAMIGALYGLPAKARYRVIEQYQFVAAAESGDVALGVLVPQSGPYQDVSVIDVGWSGARAREWAPNLEILMLSGSLPTGATETATVSYEVVLPQGRTLWDAPVDALHLSPQEKVESDAAPIAQLAAFLSEHNAATRRDVFAIYSFVAGYLAWPTEDRINVSPTALDALFSGVGGCEDFANLMVALCRATGAPAQVISGLYFPETLLPFVVYTSTWNHPAGAHAWVEFNTEAGWEMADPSHASAFMPLRWRAFGQNDGRHLSYGEAHAELDVFAQMQAWAMQQGKMVAAMSAPLKFVATATAAGVNVTPTITVQKLWDGVWLNVFLVFVVTVVLIRLLENHFTRRRVSSTD